VQLPSPHIEQTSNEFTPQYILHIAMNSTDDKKFKEEALE